MNKVILVFSGITPHFAGFRTVCPHKCYFIVGLAEQLEKCNILGEYKMFIFQQKGFLVCFSQQLRKLSDTDIFFSDFVLFLSLKDEDIIKV